MRAFVTQEVPRSGNGALQVRLQMVRVPKPPARPPCGTQTRGDLGCWGGGQQQADFSTPTSSPPSFLSFFFPCGFKLSTCLVPPPPPHARHWGQRDVSGSCLSGEAPL